ncbi:MAG: ATP synthase subunit I [Clostridia bacterium]|nr:ATP synthase subunit I [Clostridia bacterium]
MYRNRDVIRQIGRVTLGEVVCVAIMLGVYALLGYFTMKVLLGALLGCLLAILNFFFLSMAVTRAIDRATTTGEAAKAKLSVQSSSTLRLLAMAVVLFIAFQADVCDPLASLLPLLFLQISMNIMEFFRKDGEKSK